MRRHAQNVRKMKNIVCNDYQYDYFANEPLKAITTGKEVHYVAQHMLSFADVGNECVTILVENCLVKQKM